jgi:hypothetical protein
MSMNSSIGAVHLILNLPYRAAARCFGELMATVSRINTFEESNDMATLALYSREDPAALVV